MSLVIIPDPYTPATASSPGAAPHWPPTVGPGNDIPYVAVVADPATDNSILTSGPSGPVYKTIGQIVTQGSGTTLALATTLSAKALLGVASLACDTLGGFEFVVSGTFNAVGVGTSIGINGATPAGTLAREETDVITGGTSVATADAAVSNSLGVSTDVGGWFLMSIGCKYPESIRGAARWLDIEYHYLQTLGNGTTTYQIRHKKRRWYINEISPFSELTDVSLVGLSTDQWAVGCKWTFKRIP